MAQRLRLYIFGHHFGEHEIAVGRLGAGLLCCCVNAGRPSNFEDKVSVAFSRRTCPLFCIWTWSSRRWSCAHPEGSQLTLSTSKGKHSDTRGCCAHLGDPSGDSDVCLWSGTRCTTSSLYWEGLFRLAEILVGWECGLRETSNSNWKVWLRKKALIVERGESCREEHDFILLLEELLINLIARGGSCICIKRHSSPYRHNHHHHPRIPSPHQNLKQTPH